MFTRCALLFTIIAVAVFVSLTAASGSQSKARTSSSSITADHLVEIKRKDLDKLKNLYTPDGKKSYIAYLTISNYILWFKQNPKLKEVKFFCLNGDFSDGTFIVTNLNDMYADTLNESSDRLYRLLQLFDYSKGYIFPDVRTEIEPIIKSVLEKLNVEVTLSLTSLLYCIRKEDALKWDVQIPEGIELRQLREHDVEKAYSVWSLRNVFSLEYLQRMAKYNPQIGAFTNDGNLAAWSFSYASGFGGPLQCDEMHYGKGYGKLIAKYVTKKIAEKGHDIYGAILETNIASRSLFDKLGAKTIGHICVIETKNYRSSSA